MKVVRVDKTSNPVPSKDMQTPPLSKVFSMKDAVCAETNEKSISRFSFFKLWSFFYSKYG